MFTHKVTVSWSNAGGTVLSRSVSLLGGSEHNIQEAIPATTNDKPVEFALDISQCKVFMLVSDKDVTIETNAADHSGGNIFTLPAGRPFVWFDGMPAMRDTAGNLVVDIASLYITNAGDTQAVVDIRSLLDPTV